MDTVATSKNEVRKIIGGPYPSSLTRQSRSLCPQSHDSSAIISNGNPSIVFDSLQTNTTRYPWAEMKNPNPEKEFLEWVRAYQRGTRPSPPQNKPQLLQLAVWLTPCLLTLFLLGNQDPDLYFYQAKVLVFLTVIGLTLREGRFKEPTRGDQSSFINEWGATTYLLSQLILTSINFLVTVLGCFILKSI